MIDESTSYCHNHCNCSVLCNAYSTPPTLTLLVTLPLSLVARWWRQRPYTYPTPTVHHPTTIVKIRDVSPITLSPLIPMATSATTRLFPAHLHPIEGIFAAIAMVGGGLVILRQFLYTNRIFFTSVRGWIWDNTTSYGTNQRQPYITQQSNGVGVRFLCGDDGREAFI